RWRPSSGELHDVNTAAAAFEAGVRALARRELTVAELTRRLEQAGFCQAHRQDALARPRSTRYLHQRPAALERAPMLARRGRCAGDTAISADRSARGAPEEAVAEALASLEPEVDRARAMARKLGDGPGIARALFRKGFTEDAVLAIASGAVAGEP